MRTVGGSGSWAWTMGASTRKSQIQILRFWLRQNDGRDGRGLLGMEGFQLGEDGVGRGLDTVLENPGKCAL